MAARNVRTPRSARPPDLGSTVRARRLAAGLTVSELARRARIDRRTVQRLEAAGAASADTICAVERELGLSTGTLVPGWDCSWTVGDDGPGDTPGARMRWLRLKKGISQKDMCFLLRLDPGTLSRMERGVGEDLEEEWLQLIWDYRFGHWLDFRSHDDLEAWLLGSLAYHDLPRGVTLPKER